MQKVKFIITIKENPERIWKVLWDDASYRDWTSIFSEGSYAVTDWNEGSKVLFLSPNGEGMVSTIAALKPNEFMSFKHLGTVKNGVEDFESEESRKWSGALENYTLKDRGGETELTVEMDVTAKYEQYFKDTWPKALEKVKELAEQY